MDQSVRVVVSASAIGYYGGSLDSLLVDEDGKSGDDFLAHVVADWEKEVDSIGEWVFDRQDSYGNCFR